MGRGDADNADSPSLLFRRQVDDISLYQSGRRKLFYLQAYNFVMPSHVFCFSHTIAKKHFGKHIHCYIFVKCTFQCEIFFGHILLVIGNVVCWRS